MIFLLSAILDAGFFCFWRLKTVSFKGSIPLDHRGIIKMEMQLFFLSENSVCLNLFFFLCINGLETRHVLDFVVNCF